MLERLVSPPLVIIVSAFERYAIKAFDMNAVDYLLKPVQPERLARALGRARKLGAPFPSADTINRADHVFLDTGKQAFVLSAHDIAAIKAEGNYTHVFHSDGRSYMVRVSLGRWEARLRPDLFLLLDRSLLINRAHVVRCVCRHRRAELYLGSIPQPFFLGRTGLRRFKETLMVNTGKRSSL